MTPIPLGGRFRCALPLAEGHGFFAAVDDEAETDHGTAVTIDVLANDSDPDGDDLTIAGVTQPANGTATSDGVQITYTAGGGYSGIDSFTYTISDGKGGTAQATVTITVHEPPNTSPTIEAIPDQESTVGDEVTLQVEADDPDGDPLTYAATGLPPGLGIDSGSGEITGNIEDGADVASPYTVEVAVTDEDGAAAGTRFQWTVHPGETAPLEVEIDILLPGAFMDGYGLIPVVIFGNDRVDGTEIDLSTVELEGMPVKRVLRWYLATVGDYNRDGFDDVVVLIDEKGGAIPTGTTTATLTGY